MGRIVRFAAWLFRMWGFWLGDCPSPSPHKPVAARSHSCCRSRGFLQSITLLHLSTRPKLLALSALSEKSLPSSGFWVMESMVPCWLSCVTSLLLERNTKVRHGMNTYKQISENHETNEMFYLSSKIVFKPFYKHVAELQLTMKNEAVFKVQHLSMTSVISHHYVRNWTPNTCRNTQLTSLPLCVQVERFSAF